MAAQLGLGTAQFGSDYGISNPRGKVAEAEVRAILELAADTKILNLDVAPYDGHVERILSKHWPFPSPFKPQVRTIGIDSGIDWVETRLKRSVEYLGLARAYTLMVDRASDLMAEGGDELWERIQRLKTQGLARRIGISAYHDEDPVGLARRFKPDVMQVPVSMFDQRLVQSGAIATLADMGVTVQIRSIFLQGLIFAPREALPANLAPIGPQLSRLRRHLMEAGADPLHACLAYALNVSGVSEAIVGVTSAAELRAIIAASERPKPRLDYDQMQIKDAIALDPRHWFDKSADLGLDCDSPLIKVA